MKSARRDVPSNTKVAGYSVTLFSTGEAEIEPGPWFRNIKLGHYPPTARLQASIHALHAMLLEQLDKVEEFLRSNMMQVPVRSQGGLYEAYLSHIRNDGGGPYESKVDIFFEADDDTSAVLDAIDWFAGRVEALPEHFKTLAALKVYRVTPTRVKDKYLSPNSGLPLYEWKYDWGVPLPSREVTS